MHIKNEKKRIKKRSPEEIQAERDKVLNELIAEKRRDKKAEEAIMLGYDCHEGGERL